MKKFIFPLWLAVLAGIGLAGPVAALPMAPNSLTVDFRDRVWNPRDADGSTGVSTMTYDGIIVSAMPDGQKLTQYSDDGYGVYYPYDDPDQPDELDTDEWLKVEIARGILLKGAWVSDLFDLYDNYQKSEWGYILLNGNKRIDFTSAGMGTAQNNSNGEQFVPFNYADPITTIYFYPGFDSQEVNGYLNDYSVIGFAGAEPVPEPASMFLFGTGLVGIAGLMRRRVTRK